MSKIKKRLKRQGPITTIIFLTLLIGLISFIFNLIKISGNTTEAGTLETTLVTVNNIFSKDGIKYLLNNSVINFQLMKPLIYLIMSLIATSILESSGLLNHIISPLKKVRPYFITMITVLVSIVLSFIGDYSYIILFPMVSSIYKILGRNPLLGIITSFIGVTIGYGSGMIFSYQDYLLSITTAKSATNIDSAFEYNLWSNLYIMIVSTIVLTIVSTLSIEKLLAKKFKRYDEKIELNKSKKALKITTIIFAVLLAFIIYSIIPGMPLSGMLLNSSEHEYIAKLFGDTSAFGNGLMLIIVAISVICSFVYGRISGNIRNTNDYTHSLTQSFENTGYILVLLFFASIMLGLLEWSNIPTVIGANIVDFVGSLNFNGTLLIIIAFISIVIISIIMPSTITKWNIVAPVYVPLLMRANITPAFTQTIFMSSDAIGKCFSPVYIYLIIMIGFLYKQDKQYNASLFGLMKTLMPIILLLLGTYIILVLGWYLIGLPIGINASIIM